MQYYCQQNHQAIMLLMFPCASYFILHVFQLDETSQILPGSTILDPPLVCQLLHVSRSHTSKHIFVLLSFSSYLYLWNATWVSVSLVSKYLMLRWTTSKDGKRMRGKQRHALKRVIYLHGCVEQTAIKSINGEANGHLSSWELQFSH